MKNVVIVDQQAMSKPAERVLKTASRLGVNLVNGFNWESVYEVPFFKAFTKSEIREFLSEFVFHTNDAAGKCVVRLKDCKIVKGEITDMDSTNMSHAGAYYAVWIQLPETVVLGTSLEERLSDISAID